MAEKPNNSRKKVLYVITKGNFGGAQRYVFDLATNLSGDEFEVVVACGQGGTLKEKLNEKNKIRTIELESSQRNINFLKDLKTFFDLIRIIKDEKPDVVHLNSSKIGLLGSLSVFYLSIIQSLNHSISVPKAIFTAHGWAFNEERNLPEKFVLKVLQWMTVLLCQQTIAVTESLKNDFRNWPWVGDKIAVVNNGIAPFKLESKKHAREILGVPDPKKLLILSLSELHQNKGLDFAIRAIASLPEKFKEKIIYCICGEGEERQNLEKLIPELEIENSIKLLGFMPDAKKFLSGANIFLLPSRTEAFPYVILEAGFAGLPTISTSVGGIPEVIKDMQNGILVYPKNPREIAEAITYLLDHPEKQKEFGSEIRNTVMNFFTLEKMISETIGVYKLT